MKFKRFKKFKEIINKQYSIDLRFLQDYILRVEACNDVLFEIIDHYERVLTECGIEFCSFKDPYLRWFNDDFNK